MGSQGYCPKNESLFCDKTQRTSSDIVVKMETLAES